MMRRRANAGWVALALFAGSGAALAAGNTYGPVAGNETLSQIAIRFRPEPVPVSTCQTALAIYWANPDAFKGSIRNLKPGAVLKLPSVDEIHSVDPELAKKLYNHPKFAFPTHRPGTVAAMTVAPTAPKAVVAPAPPPAAKVASAPEKPKVAIVPTAPAKAAATAPEKPTAALVPLAPAKPKAAVEPAPAAGAIASMPPAVKPAPGPVVAPVAAVAPVAPPVARVSPVPAKPVTVQAPPPVAATDDGLQTIEEGATRRRPGEALEPRRATTPTPLTVNPNRDTGLLPVAPPPQPWKPEAWERVPIPDRWRILNSLDLVPDQVIDPYHQNTLKGDKPIRNGDEFLILNAIYDGIYEPRKFPQPVGPQSTSHGGKTDIFGSFDNTLINSNLILSLVYLKGDTTFRPPDYEFHFTPVVSFNYAKADEARVLSTDPQEGGARSDSHIGVQELFVDYHVRNVSDRFDFDSFRAGIQPFSSDFRGFLFQDNQLALRYFGNRDNNRWQYNLAWIRRLEKDTNSGLNTFDEPLREDDTYIANVYRQDFPVVGFTSQAIVAHNRNREGDGDNFYNDNGFIERPASLGTESARSYHVTYVGYNGDGHFGRLNLTMSTYLAAGRENHGVFTDHSRSILAGFGAAEASFDWNWVRSRLSVMYQSGDHDPYDHQANGYDAIFENPIFAGADTSFWFRQSIPLIGGGGVNLSTRNGLLNDLRTSKEHGQSNFANPGLLLLGVGNDFDVSPQVRFSTNFNHLWFDNTTTLEVARNQGSIHKDIGWDLSGAFIWRPFFQQNIVFRLSGAYLVPGDGFKDLYPDSTGYSILGNLILTY